MLTLQNGCLLSYHTNVTKSFFLRHAFVIALVIVTKGRRTDAFTWPSPLRHFLKCLPNLSSREQPLLLALDVFSVGWVTQKTTHDPTYSS